MAVLSPAQLRPATNTATQEIESWLNQFGTTRLNIGTDEHFSIQDAELDLLIPLYEQKRRWCSPNWVAVVTTTEISLMSGLATVNLIPHGCGA